MRVPRLSVAAAVLALLTGPLAAQAPFQDAQWPNTDFSRHSVPLDEIRSGGPGRDGIPAIDGPEYLPVAEETRLGAREPVLVLALDDEVPRAYPLRYLTWHEIVNDVIGGVPVSVTFCPLCNSAIVFDGRLDGMVLTFGVSGNLRHSDMVMYDRQTESWWQQAIGEGIVGEMTGAQLVRLPSRLEGWEAFRTANPDALVMDQPRAGRPYGRNPYVGYDGSARPFLYAGETPPHGISPLARVVAVGDRAWPLDRLRLAGEIAEAGLTLTWAEGQASALDAADISAGREVGSVRVRDAGGRDVVHDVMFAFAFHAFRPDGTWMLGD
jgi:hypothetical protein